MTNSQPRASRPSAIRRRPQSVQSVDEFIQAGVSGDPAIGETSHVPDVSPTTTDVPETYIPDPPPPRREGKAYFALFLGACALGISLFSLYHSTWGPLREIIQGVSLDVPLEVPQIVPQVVPPVVIPAADTFSSAPIVDSPQTFESKEVKGTQWIAITNLQFARHDLLLGLNTSARDSLILAKLQMSMLGEPFSAEADMLDRIISRLDNAAVLSLGELDSDIEALKDDWLQFTFGSSLRSSGGILGWLLHKKRPARQDGRSELETTEEGRYLVARLDRLKWLALWGDENGFRQASASIETFLGTSFLESSESKSWQYWIRKLQRIPLRHDVTELTTLIVRLARIELSP